MSVAEVAGINGARFRMFNTLKKFARMASFDPSPRKRRSWQEEVLTHRQIHGCVTGACKDIATTAARPKRRDVKLSGRIREDSIDPLLLGRD